MARETLDELVSRIGSVSPDVMAKWIEESLTVEVSTAVVGVRRHFAESIGPDRERWPALKWDRPGPTKGQPPLMDAGNLMRSIAAEVRGNRIVLWTDKPYAALQNFGGTIVPVNARYLTIPKTYKAKTAKSPRNYSGVLVPRVNKERTRGVLLAEGDDPDSPAVDGWHVAYILTTGPVEIPARMFLGFRDDTADEILGNVLETVVDRWLLADSRV